MSNNRNLRYHPFQVSLHWLVVILIFAAFLLGKSMSGLPNDPAKIPLLALHMLGREPQAAHPEALGAGLRGLRAVGLDQEARAIAIATALQMGL